MDARQLRLLVLAICAASHLCLALPGGIFPVWSVSLAGKVRRSPAVALHRMDSEGGLLVKHATPLRRLTRVSFGISSRGMATLALWIIALGLAKRPRPDRFLFPINVLQMTMKTSRGSGGGDRTLSRTVPLRGCGGEVRHRPLRRALGVNARRSLQYRLGHRPDRLRVAARGLGESLSLTTALPRLADTRHMELEQRVGSADHALVIGPVPRHCGRRCAEGSHPAHDGNDQLLSGIPRCSGRAAALDFSCRHKVKSAELA